jgi:hypothetical protein
LWNHPSVTRSKILGVPDSHGNYWMRTEDGVFSADSGQSIKFPEACITFFGVQYIFDKSDRLWFTCSYEQMDGSVTDALFTGERIWTHENSDLLPGVFLDLEVDIKGNIVVLTSDGVSVYNPDFIAPSISPSPSLPRLWGWLKKDELVPAPLNHYSLIPLTLFVLWAVFSFKPGSRLSCTGLLLGILATAPIWLYFFCIVLVMVLSGTMSGEGQDLPVLFLFTTPISVLGIVADSIALAPFGKVAIMGLLLNFIGLIAGVLWLVSK